MKRVLSITTAALLGASFIAAPAMATDLGTGLGENAPLQAPLGATSDIDTGTTASVGATFDSAVSAINESDLSAELLSGVPEVTSVEVVRLGALEGQQDTTLKSALEQNRSGVDALRAAVGANSALSTELTARGIDPSGVVGATIGTGGAVTVYVN